MKIKIEEKTVRSLPLTTSGQRYYFDTKFPGFGICVGKHKKTFFLQRTKNYKTTRTALGCFPEINCTQARDKALAHSVEIASNDDFHTQRKSKKTLNQLTLQALYERYKSSLIAQQKRASLNEYPQMLQRHFYDWLSKPITQITKDAVIKRHQYITQHAGPSSANKCFRLIRALFNYAMIDHDIINPVHTLKDRKLWNKESHKTTRIKPNELQPWMHHLQMLPSACMKLYLAFLLLHGLRRSEASNLRWDDIDFKNKCFTIHHTKNKKPLTLPITPYAEMLFSHLEVYKTNQWVFPSKSKKSEQIKAPKKSMMLLNQLSGTNVTPHDLRRTFVSIANSVNISPYTLKRLINHSMRNDVTSIYISDETSDLMSPLETIQRTILNYAKIDLRNLIY